MNMSTLESVKAHTYELIDRLKAICTESGLGNSGNEYKIITQAFLYKFLNDKFFHYMKQLPGLSATLGEEALQSTAALEAALTRLPADTYEFLLAGLPAGVARFHPSQYISALYKEKGQPEFHKKLDETLMALAENNKEVFSVRAGEGNRVNLFEPITGFVLQTERKDDFAAALIEELVSKSFENLFEKKYDFYADIFEHLIGDYNKDSGKYAEYYTPHSIAKIIARIMAPKGDQNVTIYDPAAGSGTLVLTLADQIGEENSAVYTQDISQKSNEILRLNLVLNNLVKSLPNAIQDDTLVTPRHLDKSGKALKKFDYIVSNPPFNTDFSSTRDTLAGDAYKKRFFAGVPNIPNKKKESMAIYQMFLQHIIVSMKEGTGKAAIVVPTGFLTAATGIGFKIRQHIMEANNGESILRGVVSMPSNIFANTGTNVSVLFLDQKGPQDGLITLIDASNLGTKVKLEGTKNQRTYLSKEEMNRIVKVMNYGLEQEDFSVLVDAEEIKKKKCSFSAGQYFKVKIEYVDLSPEEFAEKIKGYQEKLDELFAEGQRLEREIKEGLEELQLEKM